ncbi:hypothetical protein LDENG_00151220, partial [Lucifuga dentata]
NSVCPTNRQGVLILTDAVHAESKESKHGNTIKQMRNCINWNPFLTRLQQKEASCVRR